MANEKTSTIPKPDTAKILASLKINIGEKVELLLFDGAEYNNGHNAAQCESIELIYPKLTTERNNRVIGYIDLLGQEEKKAILTSYKNCKPQVKNTNYSGPSVYAVDLNAIAQIKFLS